jgi:hypothetical protein
LYNKEKLLANGDRAEAEIAGKEFGLSAGNAKFLLRDVREFNSTELTIARNECSECGDIRGRWRKKCEDRQTSLRSIREP